MDLSEEDKDRLIRMAWEDRTTFEAIKLQFGLTNNQVIKFMRANLDLKTFARWRKRTNENTKLKHEKLRGFKLGRFKSRMQRMDGSTKN